MTYRIKFKDGTEEPISSPGALPSPDKFEEVLEPILDEHVDLLQKRDFRSLAKLTGAEGETADAVASIPPAESLVTYVGVFGNMDQLLA